jgi:hypothetical protein
MKQLVLVAVLLAGAMPAWADVYRCTGPDGRTVYQESPCATGTQKTIDDSRSRQRQRDEAQKREESAKEEEDKKFLRMCLSSKTCGVGSFVSRLEGKKRAFVSEVLGDPESVQSLGGQDIHYFTVPVDEGRKRARLQLVYSFYTVERVNAY